IAASRKSRTGLLPDRQRSSQSSSFTPSSFNCRRQLFYETHFAEDSYVEPHSFWRRCIGTGTAWRLLKGRGTSVWGLPVSGSAGMWKECVDSARIGGKLRVRYFLCFRCLLCWVKGEFHDGSA